MKLLLLAAAVTASSLLTACPLVPQCGGFQGAGDQVFASAHGDSFVACENGGFAATFADGRSFSGLRFGENVIDAATGAVAFDFEMGDETARSNALGGGDFTVVDMNEVALDHADALCRDIANQPWFVTQSAQLPVATAFVAEDATGDGTAATMLLCPDGTAQIELAGSPAQTGTYSAESGELGVFTAAWSLSGTYTNATGKFADGQLATFQLEGNGTAHWITADPTTGDLTCAR
jgi:hypothetical protein